MILCNSARRDTAEWSWQHEHALLSGACSPTLRSRGALCSRGTLRSSGALQSGALYEGLQSGAAVRVPTLKVSPKWAEPEVERGPRPSPEPPPRSKAHQTLPYGFRFCGRRLHLWGVLSRPDRRELFMSLFLVWSGCDLGGHSMFFFYVFVFLCFGQVWFSIRDSCRSLSQIENHT